METEPNLSDKDVLFCVMPNGYFPAVLITRGMLKKAPEGSTEEEDDDKPPKPPSGHRARLPGRIALGYGF